MIRPISLDQFLKERADQTKPVSDKELDEIYKTNHLWITNFVRSRLFFKEETDDVVQDFFIKIFKHLRKSGLKTHIKALLRKSLDNYLKTIYARHKRKQETCNEGFEEITTKGTQSNVYEDIESILCDSSEQDKLIFRLFVDGYTYREIAASLDCQISNIFTSLRRSRKKIASSSVFIGV
jgi:RNA polymerase sigma factor (sigma-70 family)